MKMGGRLAGAVTPVALLIAWGAFGTGRLIAELYFHGPPYAESALQWATPDPKDQQDPVKAQITQAGGTAVTELTAALDLEKPEDPNRPIVLSRLGEAYESMGKWQEAADTYQKAIALKPLIRAEAPRRDGLRP